MLVTIARGMLVMRKSGADRVIEKSGVWKLLLMNAVKPDMVKLAWPTAVRTRLDAMTLRAVSDLRDALKG